MSVNRKIDIITKKLESLKGGSSFLINRQNAELLDQIATLIARNETSRLGLSEIKRIGKDSQAKTREALKKTNKY